MQFVAHLPMWKNPVYLIPCESNACLLFRQSLISIGTKQNKVKHAFNSDILLKAQLLHTIRNFLLWSHSIRRRLHYYTEQNHLFAECFSNHRLGEFYVPLFSENEKNVTAWSLKFNLLTVFFFFVFYFNFSISTPSPFILSLSLSVRYSRHKGSRRRKVGPPFDN